MAGAPSIWTDATRASCEAQLDRIAEKLRQCQRLLVSANATAMLNCGTKISEVRIELEGLVCAVEAAPDEARALLRPKVAAACDEQRHAAKLLKKAAALNEGWSRVLASFLRGYTRSGAPAELACERQTLLRV
jgi:hypothetical protein